MKKILFAAVAASSLCLTACNNEVDSVLEQQNESNLIGFSTYAMMSKGKPIIGNALEGVYDNTAYFQHFGSRFNVAAFLTTSETNKYLNAQIQYTDLNGWDYINSFDKVYWPTKGEKLNFYAVRPYNDFFFEPQKKGEISYSNPDKTLTMTYTVPTELTKQQDLMYAVALDVEKPTSGNSVNLPFKHALNQVLFNASTDSKELFVEIYKDGIEMYNIKNSGTLNVVNGGQPAWTANAALSNYPISTFYGVEDPTSIIVHSKPGDLGPLSKPVPLSNVSNVPMLIPQKVTAWNPKNGSATSQTGAYLKIKCKLWMNNGGAPVYLHGSAADGNNDGFDYIYVPFPGKHLELVGKKIAYTLIFGGGYTDPGEPILTPITFVTEVSDWTWELPEIVL
ncbi:MAG: fimbrillin family protein [Marinifilaceae bacterium]